MSLRVKLAVSAIAACAMVLLLAPAGNAATSFGSLRTTNDPNQKACDDITVNGPCTIVQLQVPTNPNGDPYKGGAPVDGVITKFRVRAVGDGGPATVTFRLANINQLDPDNALATSAGTGPTVTVPAMTGDPVPTTEVPARLPVSKGQQIAIDASQNILATYDASGSKDSYAYTPFLVDGQGARASNGVFGELLASADIEPDADHDGFGDETQDQCPTDPTTQGPCDKTPPSVSGFRISSGKIAYSLSEAGTVRFKLQKATVGRRVGGKCVRKTKRNRKRRACKLFRQVKSFSGPGAVGLNRVALPKIHGRKLTPGLYKLLMTVTDAKGNARTASKTFRVKPARKHHKKKH
jgi:hypothetical protein